MRVKGGTRTRYRHKKIIRQTKGYYGTRHRLFRRANEAWMKAQWYAYRDRRNRICHFKETTRIPAMYDGVVLKIINE